MPLKYRGIKVLLWGPLRCTLHPHLEYHNHQSKSKSYWCYNILNVSILVLGPDRNVCQLMLITFLKVDLYIGKVTGSCSIFKISYVWNIPFHNWKSSVNSLYRQNLYVMLSINLLYRFIKTKATTDHQK